MLWGLVANFCSGLAVAPAWHSRRTMVRFMTFCGIWGNCSSAQGLKALWDSPSLPRPALEEGVTSYLKVSRKLWGGRVGAVSSCSKSPWSLPLQPGHPCLMNLKLFLCRFSPLMPEGMWLGGGRSWESGSLFPTQLSARFLSLCPLICKGRVGLQQGPLLVS